MNISVDTSFSKKSKTDALFIPVFDDDRFSLKELALDDRIISFFNDAVKRGRFKRKECEILSIDMLDSIGKIYFVGLGERTKFKADTIRRAAATFIRNVSSDKYSSIVSDLRENDYAGLEINKIVQYLVEGFILGDYDFKTFKSKNEKEKSVSKSLKILVSGKVKSILSGSVRKGSVIAESVNFARDLANMPSNHLTPSILAEKSVQMAKKQGIRSTVFNKSKIKSMKMGGLYAVSQGSSEEPRFIVLEWMKADKKEKPIVIVGKGITFDTGGISLKPSNNMDEMKFDMSGAAAVISTIRAVSMLKLPVNLVALIPAAENMPSGSAIKPGDIVKSLSGVTMEILNTDAEGRLILADALAYARRYNPEFIIDIATLTGACMVALGKLASGLFSNDDELIELLKKAGEDAGEKVWPMPVDSEYEKDIESDIADVKNIGSGSGAGAITAALFLKKHIKDEKWAHVDIAGTSNNSSAKHYLPKGATGVGVRLLVNFIESRLQPKGRAKK